MNTDDVINIVYLVSDEADTPYMEGEEAEIWSK